MESVPGDVWYQILQIGIKAKRLDHIDLCSLAIVNNYFNQLTQDPSLWAFLLSRDLPSSIHLVQAPSKALYRRKHACMICHKGIGSTGRNSSQVHDQYLTSLIHSFEYFEIRVHTDLEVSERSIIYVPERTCEL